MMCTGVCMRERERENTPVMICSSGFSLWLDLKLKSPIALESAKFPFTLLNSTQPPAL